MSRLRAALIIEGHGESERVRILLERIWPEPVGNEYLEVLRTVGVVQASAETAGRAP